MKRFCGFLAAILIGTQPVCNLPVISAGFRSFHRGAACRAYDSEPEYALSGKCGDNITWRYDVDSETLTLDGTGEMYDYDSWAILVSGDDKPNELPEWLDLFAKLNSPPRRIVIGDGITSIGAFAFEMILSVEEVMISDSVTRISEYAFSFCFNLKTVHMSKNIKEIENHAFYHNEKLTSIDLPEGLESIGEYCFNGTPLLSVLNVPDSVSYIGTHGLTDCAEWFKSHQDNDFLILGDGILYQYFGEELDVIVPDQVKSIAGNAFHVPEVFTFVTDDTDDTDSIDFVNECISSIVLPDTVTELQEGLFSCMFSLSSVTLPKNLEKIGDNAFEDCLALTALDIPETVTSIGDNAFEKCIALTALDIPESVTSIGSNAFAECRLLADIQIPSGVSSVGRDAFKGTAWLKQAGDYVVVGNGVLACFQGDQFVVKVPDGVRCIISGAITDDSVLPNIVEVQIPDSVTEIQPEAISSSLASIAGTKGSAAEQYAADSDMPFREIRTSPAGKDMSLDFEKDCWSFGNSHAIFGEKYYLTDTDRQQLLSYGINPDNVQREWSGSCTGLALTVILMKNNVFSPAELQANAKSLSDVKPTESVQSFINYYHCVFSKLIPNDMIKENQKKKTYRMMLLAENVKHGESPFLLTFHTASGSHAVVGYGQESGEWILNGKRYDGRVLVWDPNTPDALRDESCVYYDSETLEYCIPQFGVKISNQAGGNVGGIDVVCNDLSILNAYPYPEITGYQTGDVNLDGSRDVADAVLLARYLAEDADAEITDKGKHYADCNGSGVPDYEDLIMILKAIARLIQI